MELGCELGSKSCYFGDLFNCDVTQLFDAAEMFEQRGSSHGTQARKIVEDGFADFAGTQISVVRICEAVCFVSHSLQQVKPWMIQRQIEHRPFIRENDRFVLFRETDDGWWNDIECDE